MIYKPNILFYLDIRLFLQKKTKIRCDFGHHYLIVQKFNININLYCVNKIKKITPPTWSDFQIVYIRYTIY